MVKLLCCGMMIAALGLVGCAAHRPAVVAVAPAGPVFTLNTPLDRIVKDPRGKAILVRDMPGLMASHKFILFDDMSLSEIAMMSGGRLTPVKLALVRVDLAQLAATGK